MDLNDLPEVRTMKDVLRIFEYSKTAENGIALQYKSTVKTLESPHNVRKAMKVNITSTINEDQSKDTHENIEATCYTNIL